MTFLCLEESDSHNFALVQDFLFKNEETCVSLVSRFLEKTSKIYFVKDEEDITAVFSFSRGGQLLFQICKKLRPDQEQLLRAVIGKAFEEYFIPLRSIMGTLDECNMISNLAKNHLRKMPDKFQEYDFLLFENGAKLNEAFSINGNITLKCCSLEDFNEILPLQEAYELEEVVFSPADFNKEACSLVLRKNIEKGRVFVFLYNGRIVSKLTVNARGKNCVQVGGVFTSPLYRCRGFAKYLLLNFCRKYYSGKKNIVLFVKKTNSAALALYKSAGFKKTADYKIIYF